MTTAPLSLSVVPAVSTTAPVAALRPAKSTCVVCGWFGRMDGRTCGRCIRLAETSEVGKQTGTMALAPYAIPAITSDGPSPATDGVPTATTTTGTDTMPTPDASPGASTQDAPTTSPKASRGVRKAKRTKKAPVAQDVAEVVLPFGPVAMEEEYRFYGRRVSIPCRVQSTKNGGLVLVTERRATTVYHVVNGGTLIECVNPLVTTPEGMLPATVHVPAADVIVLPDEGEQAESETRPERPARARKSFDLAAVIAWITNTTTGEDVAVLALELDARRAALATTTNGGPAA